MKPEHQDPKADLAPPEADLGTTSNNLKPEQTLKPENQDHKADLVPPKADLRTTCNNLEPEQTLKPENQDPKADLAPPEADLGTTCNNLDTEHNMKPEYQDREASLAPPEPDPGKTNPILKTENNIALETSLEPNGHITKLQWETTPELPKAKNNGFQGYQSTTIRDPVRTRVPLLVNSHHLYSNDEINGTNPSPGEDPISQIGLDRCCSTNDCMDENEASTSKSAPSLGTGSQPDHLVALASQHQDPDQPENLLLFQSTMVPKCSHLGRHRQTPWSSSHLITPHIQMWKPYWTTNWQRQPLALPRYT